jgi:hypothetical protein
MSTKKAPRHTRCEFCINQYPYLPFASKGTSVSKNAVTEQIDQEFERKMGAIEDALLLRRAEKTFFLIAVTAIFILVIYSLNFGWPLLSKLPNNATWTDFSSMLSTKGSEWGEFGDFLGGVLNPAIGLGTIYLILVNVRLQKKELGLALKEMRNSNDSLAVQNAAIEVQNFQNTFFNWVSSYREIVSDARFVSRDREIIGAPALHSLYKGNFNGSEIDFIFKAEQIEDAFAPFSNYDSITDSDVNQKIDEILLEKWSDFKSKYYSADSSVNSLMGLIDWILNHAPTPKLKNEYINILASQLSLIEMTFVLYEAYRKGGLKLSQLNHQKFFDKITKYDDPSTYFLRMRCIAAELNQLRTMT